MQKKLAALALATAGLAGTAAAQAKDLTGWFVNGGVGTAHYHASVNEYDAGSESDTAFKVNGGYRWQFIGVEAGYVDLGSVDSRDSYGDYSKLSGDGWTLGLNGHFNLTPNWYLSARGGAFMWKLHARQSYVDAGVTTTYRAHLQSTDWYAGVGTGYDFNRNWSLGVAFDYYKIKKEGLDIGNRVYTVDVEYRF